MCSANVLPNVQPIITCLISRTWDQRSMQQTDTNESIVELQSERWRIKLQPASGLQTQLCQIRVDGQWQHLMPDCSAQDAPLSAANFHMLPYSNRIKDGQFGFGGAQIALDNAKNHAIHGALRKRPWAVTERSASKVSAQYDTRQHGDVNWPWSMQAQVSYALTEHTLKSEMTLTNTGDTAMPAGMGWHPYFCRHIAGANAQLLIPAEGVYPDTDGDCLPTGAPVALPEFLDFKAAKMLDAAQRIDHCLSGFRSPAVIAWPDANVELHMQASNNCQHLVLFNPDADYFAVEPVTNANDGFNLQAKGVDAGVATLQPGETLMAHMHLQLM